MKEIKRKTISDKEKILLNLFKKLHKKNIEAIARMHQLSYSNEEIASITKSLYRTVCKKAFENGRLNDSRLSEPLNEKEYLKDLKGSHYKVFWKELWKFDVKLYQEASLIIK